MPIQESYRQEALQKVYQLGRALGEKLRELLQEVDEEDLEFGVKLELEAPELEDLWKSAVEENNYMEVVFTEIMEHHDGAYLKATFRNSTEDAYAERYISVWSSGRVEMSYALFLSLNSVSARVERVKGDTFRFFFKK
jgi:hypothetical protein